MHVFNDLSRNKILRLKTFDCVPIDIIRSLLYPVSEKVESLSIHFQSETRIAISFTYADQVFKIDLYEETSLFRSVQSDQFY